MNKFFSGFLYFLLFSAQVFAQGKPIISVTVDRDKIYIGEQFELLLDARFSDLGTVSFFQVDTLPHFEIIGKTKIDTTTIGNDILFSQKIILTSWDSGRWQIPSISLAKTKTASRPINVLVTYSPFDATQDYHDVKEISDVQTPLQSMWWWYFLGLVVLIALLVLFLTPKKKQSPEASLDTNAYKIAMADLQKLKKDEIAQKDVKAFYVTLVDVFRRYLDKGKGLQSFSKTTEDLVLQLRSLNLSADVESKLVEVLLISDAVKFAKFSPTQQEIDKSLAVIQTSIDVIENK